MRGPAFPCAPMDDPDIACRYVIGAEVPEICGDASCDFHGAVLEAEERRTHARLHARLFPRGRLSPAQQLAIRSEISALTALQHPHILRLHQAIYSRDFISLFTDRVGAEPLLLRLSRLPHCSERTISRVMKQLLTVVKFMHEEGWAHRGLRLGCLRAAAGGPASSPAAVGGDGRGGGGSPALIDSTDHGSDEAFVLTDLRTACRFRGEVLAECCGAAAFVAPEVLEVGVVGTRTSYNELCDVWSCGVIAYALLSGRLPFNAGPPGSAVKGRARLSPLFRAALSSCGGSGELSSPLFAADPQAWGAVSAEARNFVASLLAANPMLRPSADRALRHRWISDDGSSRPDTHLRCAAARYDALAVSQGLTVAAGGGGGGGDGTGCVRSFGAEAALRRAYLADAAARSLHPNSHVVELLTAAPAPITHLDLRGTYLGPRGVVQVLELVTGGAVPTRVVSVDLGSSFVDDEVCAAVVCALRRPTSRIATLLLDHNPITHGSGRLLLRAVQSPACALRHVSLVGTMVSERIQRRIALAAGAPPPPPTTAAAAGRLEVCDPGMSLPPLLNRAAMLPPVRLMPPASPPVPG